MNKSKRQRFNEPSREAKSEGMCRLRYGLNANCLLKVFDYLTPYDLVQVCKVDTYFKDLIMKWTIKKRKIHLGVLRPYAPHNNPKAIENADKNVEIFRTFGKSIRKFRINVNNFKLCLETIMKYCEPATLTEVEFEIHHQFKNNDVDLNILRQSMPFFSTIRKFTFDAYYGSYEIFSEFLTSVSTTASNLQNLKIQEVDFHDGCLKNMQNLHELRLHYQQSSSFSLDELTSCWRMNPRLKVFTFAGFHNITTVGDVLSRYCSDLEEFSDVNFCNPYDRLGLPTMNRYNFLSTLPCLNSVTLSSYTFCGCDLYYPLMTLAAKNIAKLKVFMNNVRPIVLNEEERAQLMRRPLPNFMCLETVEIEVMDTVTRQCDLRCQFMFHFMSQLKNLLHFTLIGMHTNKIYKILEIIPNIRTLDISKLSLLRLESEVRNVGKTLRRSRKSFDGKTIPHLLHLVVHYPFIIQMVNDFKDVMKISVGPLDTFYH